MHHARPRSPQPFFAFALVCLVPLAALLSCTSPAGTSGYKLSKPLPRGAVLYVQKHDSDGRDLDKIIAESLERRGMTATTDEPAEYDFLVTYTDKWYWDMRMYLLDLRIDIYRRESRILVATGRSYQTSLAAMGTTPDEIIHKVVDVIVDGPIEPITATKKKKR